MTQEAWSWPGTTQKDQKGNTKRKRTGSSSPPRPEPRGPQQAVRVRQRPCSLPSLLTNNVKARSRTRPISAVPPASSVQLGKTFPVHRPAQGCAPSTRQPIRAVGPLRPANKPPRLVNTVPFVGKEKGSVRRPNKGDPSRCR